MSHDGFIVQNSYSKPTNLDHFSNNAGVACPKFGHPALRSEL